MAPVYTSETISYLAPEMENIAPKFENYRKDSESPTSKMNHDVKFTLLDTHAMAYKLLLMDSGCEDLDESSSVVDVSEHGKEARMEFYKNRSRSDGASAIMKECLQEMKQQKEESSQHDDAPSMRRSSGSFDSGRRRKLSEPQSVDRECPECPKEPSELEPEPLEMPKRGPLMYLPAVDSSEHLLSFDQTPSIGHRKRLFNENRFVPYFTLPSPNFILHCLLDERKICLESFESKNAQLSGAVLVKHSPHPGCDENRKRVIVRMTMDEWKTYRDIEAKFFESSKERQNVDRFKFGLNFAENDIRAGRVLEFALTYQIPSTDGRVVSYWDNNNKANYTFWYSA